MEKVDFICGMDSRGFIYGSMIANMFNKGFIMIRNKGKLPGEKLLMNCQTEYGTHDFEIMKETINKGENILIVDDLMATGGTCKSGIDMIHSSEAKVIGCYTILCVEPLKEVCRKKLGEDMIIDNLL